MAHNLPILRLLPSQLDDPLPFTILIHEDRSLNMWVAVCSELTLESEGDTKEQARLTLFQEIRNLLESSTDDAIAGRMALGHTPEVEVVKVSFEQPAHRIGSRIGRLVTGAATSTKTVSGAVARSGSALIHKADDARDSLGEAVSRVRGKADDVGETISGHTFFLLNGFTELSGGATESLSNNSSLRNVAKKFKLERWLDVIENVDVQNAQEYVSQLQQKHQEEVSKQIARRLTMRKSLTAGAMGGAKMGLPNVVSAFAEVDGAATALLQAELVYQIAAAYNLDLDVPARKGEVLGVFGCVLGTNIVVKAGLTALKTAPAAGIVTGMVPTVGPLIRTAIGFAVGASANAAMIHVLGRAATRFYEEKLHLEISPTAIESTKQESQSLLQEASTQEAIMDQILMHMLMAGQPHATTEETLEAIKQIGINPVSVQEILEHLHDAPCLDELLEQLQDDFAAYLWGRCHQIAQEDGAITDEEEEILDKITRKFENKINVETS